MASGSSPCPPNHALAEAAVRIHWKTYPQTRPQGTADEAKVLKEALPVFNARFELQRDGYVAAFRNARVLETIRSGRHQAIAVTMVQWTGPALQVHVVPWMRVADAGSAEAFAAAVAVAPRQLFGGGTSISGAID